MSDFTIKIQDNTSEVKVAEDLATERALYYAGVNFVASTVDYMSMPDFTGKDIVDTGRLRASISFITPTQNKANQFKAPINAKASDNLKGRANTDSVIVGSNVEYANWVENGTRKQPARYFLRTGMERSMLKVEDDINKIFKGEL